MSVRLRREGSNSPRSLCVSLAAVFALVACAPANRARNATTADSASQAQARAAYETQVTAAWSQKYNAGDAAGIAALYTPDAIRYPNDAPPINGRAAIQAEFQKEFASFSSYKETTTPSEIHIYGNRAVDIGSWSVDGTLTAGGKASSQSGKYMALARRDPDGTWKIYREMWTSY